MPCGPPPEPKGGANNLPRIIQPIGGTISLTNGSTINAVFWVLDGGKIIALDVQTTDPELIGMRRQ